MQMFVPVRCHLAPQIQNELEKNACFVYNEEDVLSYETCMMF